MLAAVGCLMASGAGAQPRDLGRIDFPTSGGEAAQTRFIEGVAALHSFWYEEALEAFQAARTIEPDFAMAAWGEAMAHNHPLWREQDLQAARTALQTLGKTRKARSAKAPTERERGYLAAVEVLYGTGEKDDRDRRYAQAMAKLSARFPEDREAQAFHALALLGTVPRGETGFRRQMKAAAILEPIFRDNPDHPGAAHYLIHSYDDPDHAPLGLPAALRYAEIAPAAHHALHMPTHIFVQLGMWERVASSNRAAYDASDAWVKRKDLSLFKRDFHSLSWLQYSQLQLGRHAEALRSVEEMRRSARETGDPRSLRYVDEIVARQVIETRDWALANSLSIEEQDDAPAKSGALLAAGLAAAHTGDEARAFAIADRLGAIAKGLEDSGRSYRALGLRISQAEVRAVAQARAGRTEQALEAARTAVSLESEMGPPSGPPYPIKPALELQGELLLELDRGAEAERAFAASLEHIPGRSASRIGLARATHRLGKRAASEHYQELLELWQSADPDLPELAEARTVVEEAGEPE
jgi:hypothetical protein